MSQTLVKTIAGNSAPVMERYVQQSKEWQGFVCSKLTAPIERVLRDLYNAAKLASKQKGVRDVEPVFRMIVARVSQWSDEECAKEFTESPKEIDACIRMAVRARAIVMALTISRQCKEIIKVPNSQTFFRRVLVDTAGEHGVDVFGSHDFVVRTNLRQWITDNIIKHLLSLVPVSLFTEEDDAEPEQTIAAPQAQEAVVVEKPIAPLVCDDKQCTASDEPIPSTPPPSPQNLEERKVEIIAAAEEAAAKVDEPVEEPPVVAESPQVPEPATCPVSQESQDDIV